MKKAIPYYRVSTPRQGKSGLGLDVQQKSVGDYAAYHELSLLEDYIEIETGKNNKRPVLKKALQRCKKEDAVLLIAKLDRLGRNVAFISALMESEVRFVAIDNPQATPLVLHMLAAFAEHEGREISDRTKQALAAAKKRGVQLGRHGALVLSKRNKEAAKQFAKKMEPILWGLQEKGFKTLKQKAAELNRLQIPTFQAKGSHKWHITTVHMLLSRIKKMKQPSTKSHGECSE